jgi:hypothetical protein
MVRADGRAPRAGYPSPHDVVIEQDEGRKQLGENDQRR